MACSTIYGLFWGQSDKRAYKSFLFLIAVGNQGTTRVGIIRIQARSGSKRCNPSRREAGAASGILDFVPQPGDIVVKEHWAQSGFANTDLDFQLKQHGVTHVIAVGLLANTCIESTSRFAMELGYHVTLVRDATAAFNHERMDAAHDLNGPTFAHAILTTPELLAALTPATSEALR